jgi:Na+-transporting methylmalonyl-CoA/oxaloacetate decarboxylase gamma subunit
MDTLSFGLTLLIVGMGGTLVVLYLLTLLIRGLTAIFPKAAAPAVENKSKEN